MTSAERPSRLGALLAVVARRFGVFAHLALVRDAERRLASGDFTTARSLLDHARSIAPGYAEPVYLLGRLARAAQDRAAEEAAYQEALVLDPAHRGAAEGILALRAWRYAPVMEAWQRYHAQNFAEALARFRVALGEVGGRVPLECRAEIESGIGWAALALGDPSPAKAAFDAALAADPTATTARYGSGIAAYRLGLIAAAETAFSELVAARPTHAEGWSWAGWCAYARDAFAEARLRFMRASAENPLLADPVFGCAWTAVKEGDTGTANAEFRRALELGARHPSRSDLRTLVLTDERYAELGPALARALSAAGLPAEALALLEALPPRRLARGEGRVLAAATHVALLDFREAAALLEELSEAELDLEVPEALATGDGRVQPARVSARELLARAELAIGSTATARTLLERVIERDATAVVARAELAEACLWLGDTVAARAALDGVRGVEVVHGRVVRLRRELARRRRAPLIAALEALLAGQPRRTLELLDASEGSAVPREWHRSYLRGRALAAVGDPVLAEACLARAAAEGGDASAPARALVALLAEHGREDDALRLVRDALGTADDPDLLAQGLELAERSGARPLARRLRRRLARTIPTHRRSREKTP